MEVEALERKVVMYTACTGSAAGKIGVKLHLRRKKTTTKTWQVIVANVVVVQPKCRAVVSCKERAFGVWPCYSLLTIYRSG